MDDKLDHARPRQGTIVVTRQYAAPCGLVFRALTEPASLRRWLTGPSGWTMETCEVELRVGGRISFVWRDPRGRRWVMAGIYREILRPRRLVSEDFFTSGVDGVAVRQLTTIELAPREALTSMTLTLACRPIERQPMPSPTGDGKRERGRDMATRPQESSVGPFDFWPLAAQNEP